MQVVHCSQWDAWFASYAAFFLPYARMAEAEGVEMLSTEVDKSGGGGGSYRGNG